MLFARIGRISTRGSPLLPFRYATSLCTPNIQPHQNQTSRTYSNWANVEAVQKAFESVQTSTGSPWWAVIVGGTLAFRFALLPLMIHGQNSARNMTAGKCGADVKIVVDEFRRNIALRSLTNRQKKKIARAKKNGIRKVEIPPLRLGPQHAPLVVAGTPDLLRGIASAARRNDLDPVAPLYPILAHIPGFFTIIFAVRGMLHEERTLVQDRGLSEGGFAWFTDLTAVDPYFALPLVGISLAYARMDLMIRRERNEKTGEIELKGFFSYFGTALQYSLMLSPAFLFQLPAGVFAYWIPSSLFGLAWSTHRRSANKAFRESERVREAHRIAHKDMGNDMRKALRGKK